MSKYIDSMQTALNYLRTLEAQGYNVDWGLCGVDSSPDSIVSVHITADLFDVLYGDASEVNVSHRVGPGYDFYRYSVQLSEDAQVFCVKYIKEEHINE